jgi:hypothetical protein
MDFNGFKIPDIGNTILNFDSGETILIDGANDGVELSRKVLASERMFPMREWREDYRRRRSIRRRIGNATKGTGATTKGEGQNTVRYQKRAGSILIHCGLECAMGGAYVIPRTSAAPAFARTEGLLPIVCASKGAPHR